MTRPDIPVSEWLPIVPQPEPSTPSSYTITEIPHPNGAIYEVKFSSDSPAHLFLEAVGEPPNTRVAIQLNLKKEGKNQHLAEIILMKHPDIAVSPMVQVDCLHDAPLDPSFAPLLENLEWNAAIIDQYLVATPSLPMQKLNFARVYGKPDNDTRPITHFRWQVTNI